MLRTMAGSEFAQRISAAVSQQDRRYAFFLGAGCSVSSGIPAAGGLVRKHWLPELKQYCAKDQEGDSWIAGEFPDYDEDDPAASYGAVMKRLFLEPEDRQREIERLCDGCFPGFGYAVLASLMAVDGGHFNVALTTNFDDLLSDAMYLFALARPLVIQHESLATYIRPTRSRPLVVKLHGDQRLTPLNTSEETARLRRQFEERVPGILHDRGLVFLGYGGNDVGITDLLRELPGDALPLGVYWVSGSEPKGAIREWLDGREAHWVKEGDFDETMLLLRDACDLPHPTSRRFDDIFAKYRDTYEKLSASIIERPDTGGEAEHLRDAVRSADDAAPRWWSITLAAQRAEAEGLDAVDAVYEQGLAELGDESPELLGNYAAFLSHDRSDLDRAAAIYERALAVHPNNATILGGYAATQARRGADPDRVEALYEQAIADDPHNAVRLGNYAGFVADIRDDPDRVEALFERAIAADPMSVENLASHASFMFAQGRRAVAEEEAQRGEALPGLRRSSVLALALCRAANGVPEEHDRWMARVRELLDEGVRCPTWNFSRNLDRARQEEHPRLNELVALVEAARTPAASGVA